MPKARIPQVPGVGRRSNSSTQRSLVDVAEQLFSDDGYSNTSLDAIVAGAKVTKGALYHHFTGKQALFEAVFERVESRSARRISQSLKGERDPWAMAQAGLREFLEVVREPAYRRIVIQDGPAVLGYERFREQEERTTYAHVVEIVRAVLGSGDRELDDEMLETFSRIFFGALSSAGESVASSEDPEVASARVEAAIGFILAGLQTQLEAGVRLPADEPG